MWKETKKNREKTEVISVGPEIRKPSQNPVLWKNNLENNKWISHVLIEGETGNGISGIKLQTKQDYSNEKQHRPKYKNKEVKSV